MLIPKRTKFRKDMRGKNRGLSQRGNSLNFGEFGLKAIDRGFLTSRQIESARKAIAGATKRGGKVWIRIFPAKPITMKPLAVRMGKGKGAVDHYVAVIKPGKILFEMSGLESIVAKEAFRLAAEKLPMKTKFISNE
ncbi:50S ribosomal protein L16 [candidate division WWE3 bacterium CG_4_9_14_0_2_um_filter_35_11]|uniref:Large ribosomal subunit protein uL16 n=1 Tax=candidate division WWE3 bacterium CG_4_9_14_0_2_um_filter_35_11 TaxID=1975077 RepID=A0A2M8EL08_UNCKA|nr:MAG: 50S ribosomal protein L16 [candidate division WWE3 bacterium CG10_big_fil_rev_8_21_14_0_10_35_32]PJC23426.1 MAG: 50S ribosomal protein L16 [candidate division WWE3 bacterium CG_4_9_14_0_2_um_filter_35_11]